MTDALVNKGVAIVGEEKEAKQSPIVVVGTARGGTSMIAGTLAKLGVFMGDMSNHPVYEDVKLSELFEGKDFDGARQVAEEYSSKHGRWGWKRPSSIDYLDKVEQCIDNPVYIFVYKDIFSIAQRNSISMLNEILPGMERPLLQYQHTLSFLKSKSPRAMLVSYDKALSYPDGFIDLLVKFCNLEPSAEQLVEAKAFIQPAPKDYLENSRITKSQGRIDSIKDRMISGWARYVHQKKPALVQFYLNGEFIGQQDAIGFREDLHEKFSQSCAFSYLLPKTISIKQGDKITARVVDDIRDINNSPFTIQDTFIS